MKHFSDIRTKEDIFKAFDKLCEKAKEIGFPITFNTETSVPLKLYSPSMIPERIIVDKENSVKKFFCPHCGKMVIPSSLEDYTFYCEDCDEDFYSFEVKSSLKENNPIFVLNFIKTKNLRKAEKVLIDNGIDEDEAETVLQAIGYTLLDEELYPGV